MQNESPLYRGIRWYAVRNVDDVPIPPYGLMAVVGIDSDEVGALKVMAPTKDSQDNLLINTAVTIPVSGSGQGHRSFPAAAAYDVNDGTPAFGDSWGSVANSFRLGKGRSGFLIVGSSGQGVTNVDLGCCGALPAVGASVDTVAGSITDVSPAATSGTEITVDPDTGTFVSSKTLPAATVTITTSKGVATLTRTTTGPPATGSVALTSTLATPGSTSVLTLATTTTGTTSTTAPVTTSATYPGTFGVTGGALSTGTVTTTFTVTQTTDSTTNSTTTTFVLTTGQTIVVQTPAPFPVGSTGIITFSPDGKTPTGSLVYTITGTPGAGDIAVTTSTGIATNTTGKVTILPVVGTPSITGTFTVPSVPGTVTQSGGTLNLGSTPLVTGTVRVAATPVTLTGTQNDYTPPAGGELLVTTTGATTFTGFVSQPGRTFTIRNASGSTNAITLAHNSGSSSANNRIASSTGADLTVPIGGAVTLTGGSTLWVDTAGSIQTAVTAAGGGAGARSWLSYTITPATISYAGTSRVFLLVALSARQVICNVYLKHSVAFSGGAVAGLTFDIGYGVAGTPPTPTAAYSSGRDVFQAPADNVFWFDVITAGGPGASMPPWNVSSVLYLQADSVGADLDQLSAGSAVIRIETMTVPA